MDAYVTVRYLLRNICDEQDCEGTTFEEIVRMIIESEGVMGVADDTGEVVGIELAPAVAGPAKE